MWIETIKRTASGVNKRAMMGTDGLVEDKRTPDESLFSGLMMGLLPNTNHSQGLGHTNHLLMLGGVTFLGGTSRLNLHDLLFDGCFGLPSVLLHGLP